MQKESGDIKNKNSGVSEKNEEIARYKDMEKNKELTEIKETKNMETDKTDRAEALSSKIFRVIRHVVAILLSVVVLI